MRFKVSMINDQGRFSEETTIANNENEAKVKVQKSNQSAKILQSKWVYK